MVKMTDASFICTSNGTKFLANPIFSAFMFHVAAGTQKASGTLKMGGRQGVDFNSLFAVIGFSGLHLRHWRLKFKVKKPQCEHSRAGTQCQQGLFPLRDTTIRSLSVRGRPEPWSRWLFKADSGILGLGALTLLASFVSLVSTSPMVLRNKFPAPTWPYGVPLAGSVSSSSIKGTFGQHRSAFSSSFISSPWDKHSIWQVHTHKWASELKGGRKKTSKTLAIKPDSKNHN